MLTLQMPALPDPVRVVLKATTALLVFDVVDPICKNQPKCMGRSVRSCLAAGAGKKGWGVRPAPPRGPRTSRSGLLQVCGCLGRPYRYVTCSGQILQHRPRPDAKGQGDYDGDSWPGRSAAPWSLAALEQHCEVTARCTHRCQSAATDYEEAIGHIQNIYLEQRKCYENLAAEGESLNLEPYGYSVEEPQRSVPTRSPADNFSHFICASTL